MFSKRDAGWLAALFLTAFACLSIGFWLGDLRRQTVIDFENSDLKYRAVVNEARVRELEDNLRRAGVKVPQRQPD